MIGKLLEALDEDLVIDFAAIVMRHWGDQCNHASYHNENEIHPEAESVYYHSYCLPIVGKTSSLIFCINLK